MLLPTYGYQCEEHKHEFSVFQAMKDDPIKVCPTCGSPVKRLLYPVGIVFKGSGWYINDSRPPDKSESGASDKASEKSGDSKDASATPKTDAAGSSDTSGAPGDKSGDKAAPAPAPVAPSSPASGTPAGK